MTIRLSGREQETLELVCEGLLNKEIAHRLGVSEQTVKQYMMALMHKHGATNRVRLVVTVLKKRFELERTHDAAMVGFQ